MIIASTVYLLIAIVVGMLIIVPVADIQLDSFLFVVCIAFYMLVIGWGGSILVDYVAPGYHQTHLVVRDVDDGKISAHPYSDDYPILVDRDIEYRVDTSFGLFEEGSCYRVKGKGKTLNFEDNAFLQDLFNYRPDRVVTTILSKESCPSPLK